MLTNRMKLAEREWHATLSLDPKHSLAHKQLGNLALSMGDLDSALGRYRRALAGNPGNAEATFNYALVLDRLGNGPKAREAYQRFLELAKEDYPGQVVMASRRIRQLDALNQR